MSYVDLNKLNVVKTRKGFIAALDQSGGSSAVTLERYGITKDSYSSDEEMFSLIHEMRKRVFTSKEFTSDKIIGAILFYNTMNSIVNNEFTSDYLWNKKQIVSFLKVDKGLADTTDGVRLMKDIPDLDKQLEEAKNKHVFGTKMRSVIYEANEEGIKKVVDQQFDFAKKICDAGLVPIIEPEVDINSKEKDKCEHILKEQIKNKLDNWNQNDLIMFKFSIPDEDNLYLDLYNYPSVIKIVALSGGYDLNTSVEKLKRNKRVVASFSRALLENLNVNQSDVEFDNKLKESIDLIYNASLD